MRPSHLATFRRNRSRRHRLEIAVAAQTVTPRIEVGVRLIRVQSQAKRNQIDAAEARTSDFNQERPHQMKKFIRQNATKAPAADIAIDFGAASVSFGDSLYLLRQARKDGSGPPRVTIGRGYFYPPTSVAEHQRALQSFRSKAEYYNENPAAEFAERARGEMTYARKTRWTSQAKSKHRRATPPGTWRSWPHPTSPSHQPNN